MICWRITSSFCAIFLYVLNIATWKIAIWQFSESRDCFLELGWSDRGWLISFVLLHGPIRYAIMGMQRELRLTNLANASVSSGVRRLLVLRRQDIKSPTFESLISTSSCLSSCEAALLLNSSFSESISPRRRDLRSDKRSTLSLLHLSHYIHVCNISWVERLHVVTKLQFSLCLMSFVFGQLNRRSRWFKTPSYLRTQAPLVLLLLFILLRVKIGFTNSSSI